MIYACDYYNYMRKERNEKSVAPHVFGAIGGVCCFAYGMKKDEVLIGKAIKAIENPEEQAKIMKLISQETKNPEYPFISTKLRDKLNKIVGSSSIIPTRMQSPLALCFAGGMTTFLGTTVLMNLIDFHSGRDTPSR